MKLPNDLVKATDYSKAKDREIHEFEYRNGKYIHKYVLGGEHVLTPQEIVDCLNGLAVIDCDLQTAYAYIKSQKEQLTLMEKALELACEWINDIQEMDSDCPIYADCFRFEKDCDNWDCRNCDCSKFSIDHFKTKAKEMIKSE